MLRVAQPITWRQKYPSRDKGSLLEIINQSGQNTLAGQDTSKIMSVVYCFDSLKMQWNAAVPIIFIFLKKENKHYSFFSFNELIAFINYFKTSKSSSRYYRETTNLSYNS
jgi:hypothetical protein